jgi:hypothetical protein
MIDSKVWSPQMENFFRDINFAPESRIAANNLLDEMEKAARELK